MISPDTVNKGKWSSRTCGSIYVICIENIMRINRHRWIPVETNITCRIQYSSTSYIRWRQRYRWLNRDGNCNSTDSGCRTIVVLCFDDEVISIPSSDTP